MLLFGKLLVDYLLKSLPSGSAISEGNVRISIHRKLEALENYQVVGIFHCEL
jgi:hypothetical protein